MSTVTPLRASSYTFTSPEASKAAVNGIVAAIGAASNDGARPILNHVLISTTEDNEIKLVTTNSYRANRVRIAALDPVVIPPIMVDCKELKAQLPKPSEFKARGTVRLTVEWQPGERELDPGYLMLRWDNAQRMIRATPDKAAVGTYPDVEGLIDGSVADKGVTTDPVGYNPSFLADIAKEAKLVNKDAPVRVTPGASALKPAMFVTFDRDHGVTYESLLMPVRIDS